MRGQHFTEPTQDRGHRWRSVGRLTFAFAVLTILGSAAWADQRYIIRYELRQGTKSVSNIKTVAAETERTAIEIVKGQAQSERPGYTFVLKGSTAQQASQNAAYRIRYEMRQGSQSASYSKTIRAETERTAIEIARSTAESERPGYTFILKSSNRTD
ncbi:hypothetical protein Atep_14350 [Allochromatium tepidum]|uniref:Uncharacterized protein n=1 Tax=Allochromatium tepidum TaxID=553982 RepID=A0ABM7QLV4_9GAMM|nr:hypothetical protein Atep_14350 [Allochromatium tepidum]